MASFTTFSFTGELIEQNQDGLEYSSEEETEDIKDQAANLASKQRKDLAKVDHASLIYQPFRKAFYTEVHYFCHKTPTGLSSHRYILIGHMTLTTQTVLNKPIILI